MGQDAGKYLVHMTVFRRYGVFLVLNVPFIPVYVLLARATMAREKHGVYEQISVTTLHISLLHWHRDLLPNGHIALISAV